MKKWLKTSVYNTLRDEASSLYPLRDQVLAILNGIGMKPENVNMQGAAINIWDSVISQAEKDGALSSLVAKVHSDYSNREILGDIKKEIDEGNAFISDVDYNDLAQENVSNAVKTFLVYDMADISVVRTLKLQLKMLQIAGTISMFDMHQDLIGADDAKKVRLDNLGSSDIVLLMLTQSFFGKDENDCLPLTFTAFEMRKKVVPVLLGSCLWNRISILENIVPLPANRKFVTQWRNSDEAFTDITLGVERVAKDVKSKRTN